MGQGRYRRQRCTLLPTTLCRSANEQANILTPKATRRPLLAGRVPEGFPLSREIPKTGWDAEEERVIFLKRDGVDGWVGGFGTCVELGEDLF
jgi:hypothetical protein